MLKKMVTKKMPRKMVMRERNTLAAVINPPRLNKRGKSRIHSTDLS
jgi:hypothetical protein